ncbi:hypothetical protein [Marinoscillum furvescens]|uniref:Uncharacterized protein n=1 Tax=Marinoscillum furvescens DSM 4134 TaxID=1122208 RepID=A0A3D9L343_MARFU|nr:hypothetical protein [Marinoscillum furvescens]RED99567.1 hypothetical protein C7460_108189 [Marinoscillum furvescens DSM 4134]
MDKPARTFLLFQVIPSTTDYAFGSELEQALRAALTPNDTLLTLDNFSDAVTVAYAKKLLNESTEISVILDIQDTDQPGGAITPLLNYLHKHPVTCFYHTESRFLKPFLTKWKATRFEGHEELIQLIQ